jgi:hypothetical protein
VADLCDALGDGMGSLLVLDGDRGAPRPGRDQEMAIQSNGWARRCPGGSGASILLQY